VGGWLGRLAAEEQADRPPPRPLPAYSRGRVEEGAHRATPSRISPRDAPEVLLKNSRPPPNKDTTPGAGKARASDLPISACAEVVVSEHTLVRSHRKHPAFPAAMVYGFVGLSPASAFLYRHRRQILPADLTPASRRQDHTILPFRFTRLVVTRISVHRSPTRIRDDRETPLR